MVLETFPLSDSPSAVFMSNTPYCFQAQRESAVKELRREDAVRSCYWDLGLTFLVLFLFIYQMVLLCFKYLVWRAMQLTSCHTLLKTRRAGDNCSCSPIAWSAAEAWEEASVLFPVQTTAEPAAGFVSQGRFSRLGDMLSSQSCCSQSGSCGQQPTPCWRLHSRHRCWGVRLAEENRRRLSHVGQLRDPDV